MPFDFTVLDPTILANVLAMLAFIGTAAALIGAQWFRRPQEVSTEFDDTVPGTLPKAARALQGEVEAAGFRLMGLRREKRSERPYLAVEEPTNVEYEPVPAEKDLFLTVPTHGPEDFYFLSTYRDGFALVTGGGSRREVCEERFDYLLLPGQSVSQVLAEHRARRRRREAEGRELSGLGGFSGRNAACRIVFATPHFVRSGRVARAVLLACLAALWLGLLVLAATGHPPTGLFGFG